MQAKFIIFLMKYIQKDIIAFSHYNINRKIELYMHFIRYIYDLTVKAKNLSKNISQLVISLENYILEMLHSTGLSEKLVIQYIVNNALSSNNNDNNYIAHYYAICK